MTAKSARILGLCVVAGGSLFLGAHAASAQEGPTLSNPLGVYLGAGLGLADTRQDPVLDDGNVGMDRSTLGWDAFLGARPIPYLGAEIGYMDFGSARRYEYTPRTPEFGETYLHESAHAPVAFAVGYVPLQPGWDLYLKAGAARLQESWDAYTPITCMYCNLAGQVDFSGKESNWDFAYGAGTQVSFGPIAWRLEYVRVNARGHANGGDPDMLSADVSWRFF